MAAKNINNQATVNVVAQAVEEVKDMQNTTAQVTINNANVAKEENAMNNAVEEVIVNAAEQAVEEGAVKADSMKSILNDIITGLRNGKAYIGKTKDVVMAGLDKDVETAKSGLFFVANGLGTITGAKQLREDVLAVVEEGMDKGTLDGLTDMAAKVRSLFVERITMLEELGSEKSLKKALELKKDLNILEYAVVALIWAAKTIARKLKEWFGLSSENTPAILKAICKAVKAVWGFVYTLGKIVVTVVGRVASYAVAGVIKLGTWIVRTVLSIYHRIKDSFKKDEDLDDVAEEIADC